MIIKILIALLILVIGITCGAIMLYVLTYDYDDYINKRERWSRTLDEDSRVGKDKKR